MEHSEKKVAKIIEELTMYFFAAGADRIESGISREKDRIVIEFTSNYLPEYRDRFDQLDKAFHEPKNEGIEDYYWELAGSGDPGESSQLTLLGMMVDDAQMEITDAQVRLKLYKETAEASHKETKGKERQGFFFHGKHARPGKEDK